jgi:uncharacterized protein YbcI
MSAPSRGEIKAAFANAIIQFEKDHLGRGPVDARVYLIEDMVLVRLRGILTPIEMKLAQNSEGHALIKQLRRQLLVNSRPFLEKIVEDVLGASILSLHSDISIQTGEQIMVFILNEDVEHKFGAKVRKPSHVP